MNGVESKKNKLWYQGIKNRDIWKIDTINLSNKWWEDLNIDKSTGAIMTFEPISPNNLSMLNFSEQTKLLKKIKENND